MSIFAAVVFLSSFALVQCQQWTLKCNNTVLEATNPSSPLHGSVRLIDQAGNPLDFNDRINATVAGITLESCEALCGSIPGSDSFSSFSNAATNWLLPWLALAAQLPYETSGPFNNVMSVLLAVGSPAHITFGLVLTMLNRFEVSARFEELIRSARDPFVADEFPHLVERLQFAEFLLQESQQAPMRAYEGNGWLSSLILLEDNQLWWTAVKQHLRNTRRGVTISLILQLLFAVVAWLFTVVAAFGDLGDVTTALSISSSSIWLWMVPVVIGWVAVGTQARRHSIKDALESNSARAYRAQAEPDARTGDAKPRVRGAQDGIKVASGLMPSFTDPEDCEGQRLLTTRDSAVRHAGRHSTAVDHIEMSTIQRATGPESDTEENGLNVEAGSTSAARHSDRTLTDLDHTGDLQQVSSNALPGQLQAAHTIEEPLDAPPRHTSFAVHIPRKWGFAYTGDEGKEGPIFNYARAFTSVRFTETVTGGFENAINYIQHRRAPGGRSWKPREGLRINMNGTIDELTDYCGLTTVKSEEAYMSWDGVPGKVWQNICVAAVMALFVQWGTTGPSIMIGYLTPTVGLGCRSGSYLLYGCLGTFAWLMLVTSAMLSHGLMLRCQDNIGSRHPGLLPILYIITRILGYLLAAINAIWLLLSSVFELSGFFDGCWCNSNFLSQRKNGWVMLFLTPQQLAPYALKTWVGAIIIVAVVCFVASSVMWLGCKDIRNDDGRI